MRFSHASPVRRRFIYMFERKNTEALLRPDAGTAKAHKKFPIVVVLENVRSMHNVGAIFRTCDAFGVAELMLCGYTPTPPHRDIQKTALGATESVVWRGAESGPAAIAALKGAGYEIVGVEQAHGATLLQDWKGLSAGKPVALVFGNEVTGVSEEALSLCDACVEIPQFGAKHSFNISVAVGVVLWEAIREM